MQHADQCHQIGERFVKCEKRHADLVDLGDADLGEQNRMPGFVRHDIVIEAEWLRLIHPVRLEARLQEARS